MYSLLSIIKALIHCFLKEGGQSEAIITNTPLSLGALEL